MRSLCVNDRKDWLRSLHALGPKAFVAEMRSVYIFLKWDYQRLSPSIQSRYKEFWILRIHRFDWWGAHRHRALQSNTLKVLLHHSRQDWATESKSLGIFETVLELLVCDLALVREMYELERASSQDKMCCQCISKGRTYVWFGSKLWFWYGVSLQHSDPFGSRCFVDEECHIGSLSSRSSTQRRVYCINQADGRHAKQL